MRGRATEIPRSYIRRRSPEKSSGPRVDRRRPLSRSSRERVGVRVLPQDETRQDPHPALRATFSRKGREKGFVHSCHLSGNRSSIGGHFKNRALTWRARECRAMTEFRTDRRSLLLGLALAPAVIGAARAAPMTLRLSSSLPDDPKYANGRVYYDNLVKQLAANGLGRPDQRAVLPRQPVRPGDRRHQFRQPRRHRPDGHRHLDLGQCRAADRPARPRLSVRELPAADQGARRRRRQAAGGRAAATAPTSHIIGWAYNFGARSVLVQDAGAMRRPISRARKSAPCPTRSSPSACA